MNNLRKLREEKRMTANELGELRGMTGATLSRIENGFIRLGDEDIKWFSEYFNVSADYLLGLSEVRNAESELQVQIAFSTDLEKLNDDEKQVVKDVIKSLVRNKH